MIGIEKMMETIMMRKMSDNDQLFTRYMEDKQFYDTMFSKLAEEIYERVRGSAKG